MRGASGREAGHEVYRRFETSLLASGMPSECVASEWTKESAAFTDAWKAKVIADTGTHYLQPPAELSSAPAARRFHSQTARSKLRIPGVAN